MKVKLIGTPGDELGTVRVHEVPDWYATSIDAPVKVQMAQLGHPLQESTAYFQYTGDDADGERIYTYMSMTSRVPVKPENPSSVVPRLPMSMNTAAEIVGDTDAEKLISDARRIKEKLALPNQWVLMSPQGEMFVTDKAADLIRVLVAKNTLESLLGHGLNL